MGLSAKKRVYYEEHIEAWRHSGSGKLKQSETVKTEFLEAKVPEHQDFSSILQISLPNGVRIGISWPKSNVLIEQVLKFVGQLP